MAPSWFEGRFSMALAIDPLSVQGGKKQIYRARLSQAAVPRFQDRETLSGRLYLRIV